jgi:hypothetical protein
MVAVDTRESVLMASGVRDIGKARLREGQMRRAHLAGWDGRVKGGNALGDHQLILSATRRLIY